MKISDIGLTVVLTCFLVGAGASLCWFGYSYAMAKYQCVQLEEALEQCEAEKALLEALLEKNRSISYTIGDNNQGWISPSALEN